ncbi:MAG: hypothetical protein BGO12_09415 [Verrucomicrobia bacterium 61-8]|nr:MAG: hypothetical protein BGO12_09415 [Verrucomicrobia bacterium 61-8]
MNLEEEVAKVTIFNPAVAELKPPEIDMKLSVDGLFEISRDDSRVMADWIFTAPLLVLLSTALFAPLLNVRVFAPETIIARAVPGVPTARNSPIVRLESNVIVRPVENVVLLKVATAPAPLATAESAHLVGSLQFPLEFEFQVPLVCAESERGAAKMAAIVENLRVFCMREGFIGCDMLLVYKVNT